MIFRLADTPVKVLHKRCERSTATTSTETGRDTRSLQLRRGAVRQQVRRRAEREALEVQRRARERGIVRDRQLQRVGQLSDKVRVGEETREMFERWRKVEPERRLRSAQ